MRLRGAGAGLTELIRRGVGHLALWRTGVVARCVVGVPRVLVAGTVGRHDSHSTCLRSTRHTKCGLCMRSDELW